MSFQVIHIKLIHGSHFARSKDGETKVICHIKESRKKSKKDSGQEETFRSDGHVYDIDYSEDFTDVYLSPNSLSHIH